jgi:hypothetical protein
MRNARTVGRRFFRSGVVRLAMIAADGRFADVVRVVVPLLVAAGAMGRAKAP